MQCWVPRNITSESPNSSITKHATREFSWVGIKVVLLVSTFSWKHHNIIEYSKTTGLLESRLSRMLGIFLPPYENITGPKMGAWVSHLVNPVWKRNTSMMSTGRTATTNTQLAIPAYANRQHIFCWAFLGSLEKTSIQTQLNFSKNHAFFLFDSKFLKC